MGRTLQITATGIVALAIAGCTIGDTEQASNTASSTPSPTPTPQTTAKSQAANPPSFSNPVVAGQQTTAPAVPVVASLITPTNAGPYVKTIKQGRNDPFAQIVTPADSPSFTPTNNKVVPKLPPLPVAIPAKVPQKTTKLAKAPTTLVKPKPKPTQISVRPKNLPQVVPNTTLAPVLPPPAQPDGARAVFVSGVVLIGKEPQAIIKVPDEPTSRYVQAGQRLVNGVLIKRIQMNTGSEPVVILEQYGIEVARTVGEPPAIKDDKSKPSTTAAANNDISMVTPL
ncbi:hypothetical protein B6N60_02665 [Richelia sinica FACHB-800]|uniref:Uncharacterized protein n=1 Tax=Richelia sinica FACHB-800 TaxID=1357546 RepID=A0A975T9K6_9NOST|nr:hypothetical protein [Richelia sinica]MBD2665928.1 hypothetical protein [Richelia sinica FACHB-800]QXE23963.1 hypothetical protein B6N60_02665 [Richelia sinica FACHB-800]